ncbi:MAG: F0F1 ATP synthase subunit epsilon [Thermodesulfobacteriota bacterium]
MPETILLEIVTPARLLFSERVAEVTAPGWEGEFGVLPGHTPYLVVLKPGEVKYKGEKGYTYLAISRGFAEVGGDKVSLLTDAAELAHEIDLVRAQAARDRALGRLKAGPEENMDLDRAQAALQRALARVQVAGRAAR